MTGEGQDAEQEQVVESLVSLTEQGCCAVSRGRLDMTKLLVFLGSTIGGGVGWWAGESYGMMTAFVVSMIGTGVGVYAGRRIARDYLE